MDNIYNLKGKTAWITGSKRIGQKIAEVMAMHGADIVVSYKNSKKEAENTIKNIKMSELLRRNPLYLSSGKASKLNASLRAFSQATSEHAQKPKVFDKYKIKTLLVQADVSSKNSVSNAVKQIKKQFKKIDILVLMASVFERVKFDEITEENFQKNFDVHVMGTFWPIKESVSIMPKGSHIITISDRAFLGNVYRDFLPYVVTKGAVASLTKALSSELAPKGIFINSIAPGPVLKPDYMSKKEWDKMRSASIIKYPITDKEAVEEFAKLILYLSRVRSTGAIYPLDFGHV